MVLQIYYKYSKLKTSLKSNTKNSNQNRPKQPLLLHNKTKRDTVKIYK